MKAQYNLVKKYLGYNVPGSTLYIPANTKKDAMTVISNSLAHQWLSKLTPNSNVLELPNMNTKDFHQKVFYTTVATIINNLAFINGTTSVKEAVDVGNKLVSENITAIDFIKYFDTKAMVALFKDAQTYQQYK